MPDPAPTPSPEPTPPAPPVDPPAPEPTPQPNDVGALPDWAQKLIRDTRTEAATHRTKLNEATQAHQASLDAIAKALGLKQDDDPTAAVKTAAEERDAARQEAKAARVENAVLRMAAKHGANPEALTDSRSFMRTLEAIDPAADDFAAQVETAIKTAVEANPNLKVATHPAPPRSGGPVGGGTPQPGQLSREDLRGMKPEEITKAKAEGRLNQLLGITQ